MYVYIIEILKSIWISFHFPIIKQIQFDFNFLNIFALLVFKPGYAGRSM